MAGWRRALNLRRPCRNTLKLLHPVDYRIDEFVIHSIKEMICAFDYLLRIARVMGSARLSRINGLEDTGEIVITLKIEHGNGILFNDSALLT